LKNGNADLQFALFGERAVRSHQGNWRAEGSPNRADRKSASLFQQPVMKPNHHILRIAAGFALAATSIAILGSCKPKNLAGVA
jgi:hypothetical protein